ncbi:MAG: tRNA pseudouridine(55) synthase TruB, partial [Oscillospiraceae bacterium]|nr:tRNA pseudouridine(55) synthase TruB [Oscillospiraceae bacterium]
YIRSLIDDIGAELGTGAVMTSLVRTRACGFELSRSTPLEELKAMSFDELCGKILPVESVFAALPRIELDEVQKRLYLNGVRLDADRLSTKPPVDVLCAVYGGEFLGVAKVTGDELVSVKRFS